MVCQTLGVFGFHFLEVRGVPIPPFVYNLQEAGRKLEDSTHLEPIAI